MIIKIVFITSIQACTNTNPLGYWYRRNRLVLVLTVSALAGIEALKNRLVSGIGIDSIGVEQYWVLGIGVVRVLAQYRNIGIKNSFSFSRMHSILTKFWLINKHYVVEELFYFYDIYEKWHFV